MATTEISNPAQLPDPNLVTQAMNAIAAFEQSKVPGIWPAIQKAQLLGEMRSRVQDPFQVNQGQQPFCGLASLMFELIRRHPIKYVQICRNLYQIGGFSTKTRWIYPSPELLADQGNPQMPVADWMVLSTLRESENFLFPVQTNSHEIIRNIAGMTKPWEMQGWLQEIFNYQQVQFTSAFLTRDMQVLQQAANIINSGGVALALVTSEGLLQGESPPVPFPNHWVALVGSIALKNNRVSFDIFTWARKMHIDVPEDRFKSHFWGMVTGQP